MKLKIFYNKDTLKVVGMSDGDLIGNFPFLEYETKDHFHSTDSFEVVRKKSGNLELLIHNVYPNGAQ